MTGVPIYTESPITPAKPSGVTPQTVTNPQNPLTATKSTISSTTSILDYPSAQPGPVAAKPTPTQALQSQYGPPPPQPGAFPSAATTAKPSIPPPPRVGEEPKHPEYYSPYQSASKSQRPYPPQMMLSVTEPSKGQPPSSTTSTTFTPTFKPPSSLPMTERIGPSPTSPLSGNTSERARASLEHPPGYVQNPYASDMTPDQQFAMKQNRSERGPLDLGYDNDSRKTTSGFEDEGSVWEMAKTWAKGASDTVGKYVTDINEKISRSMDGGK